MTALYLILTEIFTQYYCTGFLTVPTMYSFHTQIFVRIKNLNLDYIKYNKIIQLKSDFLQLVFSCFI